MKRLISLLFVGCLAPLFFGSAVLNAGFFSSFSNAEAKKESFADAVGNQVIKVEKKVKRSVEELGKKIKSLFKKESKKKQKFDKNGKVIEDDTEEDEAATIPVTYWDFVVLDLKEISNLSANTINTDALEYLAAAEEACRTEKFEEMPYAVKTAIKNDLPIWEWPLNEDEETMVSLILAEPDFFAPEEEDPQVRVWARFLGIEKVLDLPSDPSFRAQGYKAAALLKALLHTQSPTKKWKILTSVDEETDGGLGRMIERTTNWGLAIQDGSSSMELYEHEHADPWLNRLLGELHKLPDTEECKDQMTTWVASALSIAILDGHGEGFKYMFEALPDDLKDLCSNVQLKDFEQPLLVAGYDLIAKASPNLAEQFKKTYQRFMPIVHKVAPIVQGFANTFGKIVWNAVMQEFSKQKEEEAKRSNQL